MRPGITSTKLGRYQAAEPLRLERLAVHDGSPLREVDHEIPIPVLDQEDLLAQGIDTAALVPGAQQVDALGSCTCNAGTGHLAERWVAAGKNLLSIQLPSGDGTLGITASGPAPQEDEEFAIVLYHLVTDETGDPSTEWPPVDCGSSGLYVFQEFERQKWASSYLSGAGVCGALSLLQSGTVMVGLPWFNSWFTQDAQGFVDSDGSFGAFMAAVQSGVAGGHETLMRAIPQLAQASSGIVELQGTVIRVRNSWSPSWGPLAGEYLIHASTLNYLSQYVDYKQIVVA